MTAFDRAIDRVTDAFRAHGLKVAMTATGGKYSAQCPVDGDRDRRVSIRQPVGDEKASVKCHKGCADTDVLAAVGLAVADLYDKPQATGGRAPIEHLDGQDELDLNAPDPEPSAWDELPLAAHHRRILLDSAISVDVARERGYATISTKQQLADAGFTPAQRRVPALLIPIHDERGVIALHQHRPDNPRTTPKTGKVVKYETPGDGRMVVDVPPRVRPWLGDPARPLLVTEGVRKADAAASIDLACVALLGVWNWRGANEHNGKVALAFWETVALNDRRVYIVFDSDVMTNEAVHKSLARFGPFLARRGADVAYVYLPAGSGGAKVGLDDYLAAGGTVDGLLQAARAEPLLLIDGQPIEPEPSQQAPEPPPVRPVKLGHALATFKKWLHINDDAPVLVVAATVVANNAEGDPAWLLLVGPPSSGKTETLQAAASLPYIHPAANVTESSLLSGVSRKERDVDATGGLLRQVGEYGIILCKDFTSVLSQNKDVSAAALAALREVYDGSWDRPVGAGGGRVLSWSGKCGLIGGVTPSIDRYGQVVGALGDRYLLLRLPDVDPESMANSALSQGSQQRQMRQELSDAMTGLIAGADLSKVTRSLNADEKRRLVELATFTARARTVVERNGYTREVEVLPQPEGTGRIVGQMRRLLGGLEAIGCDQAKAWAVLNRVAVDCVPRLRFTVMETLLNAELHTVGLGNQHNDPTQLTTGRVAQVVGVDWKTANRHLEDLRLLDLSELEVEDKPNPGEKPVYWHRASKWLLKHMPGRGLDEKYSQVSKEFSSSTATSSPDDDGSGGEYAGDRSFRPDPKASEAPVDSTKPDWVQLDAGTAWADPLWDRER